MCSVINAVLQTARRRNCGSARRRGVPRAAGAVAIHIFLEASFHRPAVVDQKRSGTTRTLISHQKGMKMSGIVLSASVRQNLLSLQSTAELLSTTQSRLATGNKVNSALDNPTNFFTAQGLNNRASDINNLLDSIGNGVQVLQAANTGITSLQKLVDTAKSLANQALQSAVGYSTKSNVSATIAGTTAITSGITLGGTSASLVGVAAPDGAGTAASLALGLTLAGTASASTIAANGAPSDGDIVTVNGKTITFKAADVPLAAAVPAGSGVSGNIVTDGNGNSTVYLGLTTPTATVQDLANAIDLASGVKKTVNAAGAATLSTSPGTPAAITSGI